MEKTWFSPTLSRKNSSCSENSRLTARPVRARSKSSGNIGDTGEHDMANKIRKSSSAKLARKPESSMDKSQITVKPSPFLNNALYASGGLYNSDKNSPVRRRSFQATQFKDPSANMPHGKSLSDLEEVQKESKELAAAGRYVTHAPTLASRQ